MEEFNNLLQEKLNLINTGPDALIANIKSAESEILNEIRLLLGELQRDSNGYIIQNTSNLNFISSLKNRLDDILTQSQYVEAIKVFAQDFDKQQVLNNEYYKALYDYTESSELAALIGLNKRNAIGLLLEGPIDKEFYSPIIEVITNAVSTSAPYRETVHAIDIITRGGEVNGEVVLGRLSRYAGQIAYDAMAISDRTYNKQVSTELDIQFYRYTGGLINDSRSFCKTRNGKYYHYKEIESWANENWSGKFRSTTEGSIFVYLGGYNCRHAIIPSPLSLVPKDDLKRNLNNGNLKLTDKQKEVLGLS